MRHLLPLIVCLVALAVPSAGSAATLQPSSAAEFRDSVGVNTHITYYGTAYGNWARIVEKLDELGIDHLRDGIFANPTWGSWNERYYKAVELAAAHGKRFTVGMGYPGFGAGTLDQLAEVAATRLRPAIEALESPNEYDIFGGGGDWAGRLIPYVGDLFTKAKGDPRLASLPVLGPSFARTASRTTVGNIATRMDVGNIHPYTGGNAPSAAHMAGERTLASLVSGDKPLVATEAGFHNAMNATSGQAPVPEDIAAAYTLRTLLEHYRAGLKRTFLYELIDQKAEPALVNPEEHFGLLRHDYSEKPAATALKHFLGAIGRPAAADGAEPVEADFDGDTANLQHLLLAEPDGAYKLVLWLDRSLWDRNNHNRLAVPDQTVGVTLPATGASYVRPVVSGEATPVVLLGGRGSVQVGADPVVLSFTRQEPVVEPPPVEEPQPPAEEEDEELPITPPLIDRTPVGDLAEELWTEGAESAEDTLPIDVPSGEEPQQPAAEESQPYETMSAPAVRTTVHLRWCGHRTGRMIARVGIRRGKRFRKLAVARVAGRAGCIVTVRIPATAKVSRAARRRPLVLRLRHRSKRARWSVFERKVRAVELAR